MSAAKARADASSHKRSYSSKSSGHSEFLEIMRMQMLQESEVRKAEAAARAEDRQTMMCAISAIIQGLATTFGPNNKKRKLYQDSDSEEVEDYNYIPKETNHQDLPISHSCKIL